MDQREYILTTVATRLDTSGFTNVIIAPEPKFEPIQFTRDMPPVDTSPGSVIEAMEKVRKQVKPVAYLGCHIPSDHTWQEVIDMHLDYLMHSIIRDASPNVDHKIVLGITFPPFPYLGIPDDVSFLLHVSYYIE
jgi:hypothetical protein